MILKDAFRGEKLYSEEEEFLGQNFKSFPKLCVPVVPVRFFCDSLLNFGNLGLVQMVKLLVSILE